MGASDVVPPPSTTVAPKIRHSPPGSFAAILTPVSKRFYITTAIDYVNGAPHLGHAYEKVVADVIARSRRSLGEEVFFLTGLDEHGQKVQQAAEAAGLSSQAYCDNLAVQWKALAQLLGLSIDDFIRTTEERHQRVVQAVLSKLHAAGQFYKTTYKGWYSVREETFLTEKDRNPDGTWDAKWGQVNELSEDNWYFRLGIHQAWLIEYQENHPEYVVPESRRNEVLGFLRSEKLEDLCISRPKARLSWGIPLPFDPEFVTYVWFDALVNYFSVPAALGDVAALVPLGDDYAGKAGSFSVWPADIHLIGKDILKFHAVYWPIMLRALGAPLPRQLLVHGWWQKDGQKLSKTTGNVVDPVAVIGEWGLDAFRYYVVRELGIGPDGNWTDSGFGDRYRAELANGLGNLVNRAISMLNRYRQGLVPSPHSELAAETTAVIEQTAQLYRNFDAQGALVGIWKLVNRANEYVEKTAPFRLAKDPTQATRLDEVLYNLVEVCRILAILLWPVTPKTSERIFAQLKLCDAPDRWELARWGLLEIGHQVGQPEPLFPRKDLAPGGK